jgi:hypothetical protein
MQGFDEALSELVNLNPTLIAFNTTLNSNNLHNNLSIEDPRTIEAVKASIKAPLVYWNLGLGVSRVLLLQFIQAILNEGKLVVCSSCFKPYLRRNNIVRGRNYCPDCKKAQTQRKGNDTDTDIGSD